jgi:hypothetical protein
MDLSFISFALADPEVGTQADYLFPQHARLQALSFPEASVMELSENQPPSISTPDSSIMHSAPHAPPPTPSQLDVSASQSADTDEDTKRSDTTHSPNHTANSSNQSSPTIPRTEAIMVGNLFRNVLRISSSQPELSRYGRTGRETQDSTTSSALDLSEADDPVSDNVPASNTQLWTTDASPATQAFLCTLGRQAQDRRPTMDEQEDFEIQGESFYGNQLVVPSPDNASPVLSQLAWVEESNEGQRRP